jgi:cell division septation protein DedD
VTQTSPPAATEPAKEESASPSPSQATETAAQAETKTAPPIAQPVAPAPTEPAPDEMYLQVTSLKAPAADATAQQLKKKGFPTTLSPGPSGYVRVWVGPYTDRGKLGEAKAKLEQLGFGPIVVKPPK